MARKLLHIFLLALLLSGVSPLLKAEDTYSEGTLKAVTKEGEDLGAFPLKHTDVHITVSGYIARVEVKQLFTNPYKDNIEAVYVFPLPQDSAVDDMLIKVGERTIRGLIKKRDEAKQIYEQAKQAGHIAALLEQERPNIFTQSVANIIPGDEIEVTIRYVQVLKYEQGAYECVFPMVVGPRFIPGTPDGTASSGGWAPNTNIVPDASRITPPVLKPGQRSGHDISLTMDIDAGVEIHDLNSVSHRIDVSRIDNSRVTVKLHPQDTIPNKDFILRYKVAGDIQQYALLTHKTGEQGYYLLMVQPKEKYSVNEVTPKELIFVLDCSGSMSGKPMEKAKEVVRRFLKGMNPNDTFQIIRFSENASGLSPAPIENTPANVNKALAYIDQLRGSGGTMMIEGIKASLDYKRDPNRLRIVAFLTDGYIGNETQILAAIEDKLGNARLCSFGVGTSVNRYLLERMGEAGRGFAQFVRPDEDTYTVVEKFYRRINNPCLTDINLDYKGIKTLDVYPKAIPDLFDSQPVFIYGKYKGSGKRTIELTAKASGRTVKIKVPADFPDENKANEVISTIWARAKIKDLMTQQYHGEKPEIVDQVTEIALAHRLMSKYTSFVAVEETFVVEGGKPTKVMVPVELPEYVSYEGIFGDELKEEAAYSSRSGGWGLAKCCSKVRVQTECLKQPAAPPVTISVGDQERDEIAALKITLKDKDNGTSYEIHSNGYLFETSGFGKKKLVKRLTKQELAKLKQLLVKLDASKLNNNSFSCSKELELEITIDTSLIETGLSRSAQTAEPAELKELREYLEELIK